MPKQVKTIEHLPSGMLFLSAEEQQLEAHVNLHWTPQYWNAFSTQLQAFVSHTLEGNSKQT